MNSSHLKRLFRSPLTEIMAFILIISYSWNHTIVVSGEFSLAQVILIFGYITAVIFLQIFLTCCAYYALRGKRYRRRLTAVISGTFLTINLLLLLLIHYEPFARLEPVYKYSYFAGFIFFFYALIYAMFGSALIRRGGLFAATLLLGYSVATSALGTQIDSTAEASLGEFTPVKFERKPNIYFMGLDALSPETIAKRHLKVKKVTYADALRINDFRTFKNAFADRVTTINSYNSLLALDVENFDALSDLEQTLFYSGNRPGILFETFRANGYKVQTMYMNNHFGDRQGKFVDFYGISNRRDICTHVSLFSSEFAFMGLCHKRMRPLAELVNASSGLDTLGGWDPKWADFRYTHMLRAARSEDPWVTMAHTLYPIHVKTGYNHEIEEDRLEYRDLFIEREKVAAKLISEWVDFLKREDPSAILVVFGDHGFLLSWGQSFSELETDEERRFFVLDRHAISLSVWPKETCKTSFDREAAKGYITMTQMARALVGCLAGGADPLPANSRYRLPYEDERYEDYTYELD